MKNNNVTIPRWQRRLWKMIDNPEGLRFTLSNKRFEVVAAGRRCLAKDTLVATPNGGVAIQDLKVGDTVIGMNADEQPEATTVSEVHNNGVQEVVSLYAGSEHYVSATPNHRFYARNLHEHRFEKKKISDFTDTTLVRCGLYEGYSAGYSHIKGSVMLRQGETRLANTYDITVANETNLYYLHKGGLVTSNSGKSERAKRKFIKRVLQGSDFLDPRYAICAPTYRQTKRLFWADLKQMIPPELLLKKPNESELELYLINGATIFLAGLDVPARIEGAPIDGFLFDEVDDIKRTAWEEHVDPCFIDRKAWAIYVGVPNGLGYLYELSKNKQKFPEEWDFFTWKSTDVICAEEIKKIRNRIDDRSFKQEFEAQFLEFTGQAYYSFSPANYSQPLKYNANKPLCFCFDFNTSPGVAVVTQEQVMPGQFERVIENGLEYQQPVMGTGVIGEVHIKRNSNTEIVCRKLFADWRKHKGNIICYGDPAGGNKTSSTLSGSDWDLVINYFNKTPFKNRIEYRIARSHPSVRARINAVNSRCQSTDGIVRLMVDIAKAPNTAEDFSRVLLVEGGSGEIDKRRNMQFSHLTDALGYMVAYEFPVDNAASVNVYDF